MEVIDLRIGTDYEARCLGRVTVVAIQADLTGARRCVCIRQEGGPVQRITTAEIVRTWSEVEALQEAEERAAALAEELNMLLPGLGATIAVRGRGVWMGVVSLDTAESLASRLRVSNALNPFVDAFSPVRHRYWIDEESDRDYVIRDRADGNEEVSRCRTRERADEELVRLRISDEELRGIREERRREAEASELLDEYLDGFEDDVAEAAS